MSFADLSSLSAADCAGHANGGSPLSPKPARSGKHHRFRGLSERALSVLLLEACENREAVELLQALLAAGARTDAVDAHGRTGLLWCSMLGFSDGARALAQAGADQHFPDEAGWTPVRLAATLFHRGVAEALRGVSAERALPAASLGWCCVTDDEDAGVAALSQLLLSPPVFLDEPVTSGARTALHLAASYGRAHVLATLLSAGAGASVLDASGRNAAACAAVMGHDAALHLLLPHTDSAGLDSACVEAAQCGNLSAVRLLTLGASTDPAAVFAGVEDGRRRRACLTLVTALSPAELCRALVLHAKCSHPLITALTASQLLETLGHDEKAKDGAASCRLLAAAACLEKLACAMVRSSPGRGRALLTARLAADGRTPVEVAVDARRKVFVTLPPIQLFLDRVRLQN